MISMPTIVAFCPWCRQQHDMPAMSYFHFPRRWLHHPPTPEQVIKRAARVNRPDSPMMVKGAVSEAHTCRWMRGQTFEPFHRNS
jgi:hypothetical protein